MLPSGSMVAVPAKLPEANKELSRFGMEDMPNEVLHNIFHKVESKHELLTFRKVCRRWASNISEVLGSRTNLQYSEWKLITPKPDIIEYPVPKVMVGSSTRRMIADVMFPHRLSSALNPFPTLSISLVSIDIFTNPDDYELKPGESKIGFRPLIWNHGTNLKVLHISGNAFTLPRPQILFANLPNLKTLKLKHCSSNPVNSSDPESSTEEAKKFPILRNLTIRFCKMELANWILKTFAPTLESLELGCTMTKPFTRENYPEPDSFQNLKNFKIFDFKEASCSGPGTWIEMNNLEKVRVNLFHGPLKFLSPFVSRMKETIVDFTYDKKLANVLLLPADAGKSEDERRIIYPKVSKLCTQPVNHLQLQWDLELITKSFPNLKLLRLADYTETTREDAIVTCDIPAIFKSCPQIQTIEVLYNTCIPKYLLYHCHTFTRQDF